MPKRVAILQSNYIPWKGYFDAIRAVDEFVLYDDMQYTRRDWRNRNQIKTAAGLQWLTIPVKVSGKYHQKIRDTRASDPGWGRKHWETIRRAYARAPFFKELAPRFEPLYLTPPSDYLSEINFSFIRVITDLLKSETKLRWSSEFNLAEGKTERLVALCADLGATDYYSGPAAKDYLRPDLFAKAGIGLHWFDYSGYPEYPQLSPPFAHAVSMLDLIFNTGTNCRQFMKDLQ